MQLEIINEIKMKVNKVVMRNHLGFMTIFKNHSPICGEGTLVSYFNQENEEHFYGNFGAFHFLDNKFTFATLETSGFSEASDSPSS